VNLETSYRRDGATITVMAYLGAEDGDGDEIRVIRTVDGAVVEDGIAYWGDGGEQWLREQDAAWIADGYERSPVSSAAAGSSGPAG
jgi:hypothetical protein